MERSHRSVRFAIGALRALDSSVRPRPDSRGPAVREPRCAADGGQLTRPGSGAEPGTMLFTLFGVVVVFGGGVDRLPHMDSNTHSTQTGPPGLLPHPESPAPPGSSEPLGPLGPLELPAVPGLAGDRVGLAGLPAVVGELAAEDLDRLAESALAEELLALRRWLDGLEGQWL